MAVSIISVNDVRTFIYQPALSKETFSVVFFCGQDCCFVPVYYMIQGIGVGDRGAGGAIALPFVKFGSIASKIWVTQYMFRAVFDSLKILLSFESLNAQKELSFSSTDCNIS